VDRQTNKQTDRQTDRQIQTDRRDGRTDRQTVITWCFIICQFSGHVECVKWLLANRAKHDVTDVNDRTPGDIAEVCFFIVKKQVVEVFCTKPTKMLPSRAQILYGLVCGPYWLPAQTSVGRFARKAL
jgi:hypothetical protein